MSAEEIDTVALPLAKAMLEATKPNRLQNAVAASDVGGHLVEVLDSFLWRLSGPRALPREQCPAAWEWIDGTLSIFDSEIKPSFWYDWHSRTTDIVARLCPTFHKIYNERRMNLA